METDGQTTARSWFHGLIDRRVAEQRLLASSAVNSYLIRESQNRTFVLSFCGHSSGINHFRIQHICGHFYIGSKAFPSLDQLIHFYHSSDLLRGERLQRPIAAPEPLDDIYATAVRMVAVLPYQKMADSDELTFKKGDLFLVHNDLQNGWLWVTCDRTLESGLVFGELLEPLDSAADDNEKYEWFHSRISKEEAVDRLARAGSGSFLVRPSDNCPGHYSLFFFVGNSVQRFRIERRNNRYLMGGRVFESLEEVVLRYRKEQIVEGFRLLLPVNKSGFSDRKWTEESAEELATSVYQTLRESREMARKSQQIRLQGFLLKKSQRKRKEWKKYFFVLNSFQKHLYYFESERRSRPKGVIDLNYSYTYWSHDSLHEKSHSFQVVERALPCISTVYYLAATDGDTCRQWIQNILSLCLPQQSVKVAKSGQDEEPPVRQLRSLAITLLEGQALPVKLCPNPYIEIQFNGSVKVGRSQVKCPPDPIWEEEFLLEDIPLDVMSFSFVLYNKGKRSKDSEIAETTIDLEKLREEEVEEWFPLQGLCPPIRDNWGRVRARVRLHVELVMSFGEYSAFKDLLLLDDLEVIGVCEHYCPLVDRPLLASAVLRISRFERKECQIIRNLIEREIRNENDVATLFRSNSLTTALIDVYMKAICLPFLRRCLQEPIARVLESRVSCELNPSRLDSPSEACHNAEHLLDVLDSTIDQIFRTAQDCPPQLRYICGCLQRAVQLKWPNDFLVRTRVVGGFVFLRLICPAILNPRNFSLINEIPSETASRTLILMAKSIQNLSNLIEFGTKSLFISEDRFEGPPPLNREPWMEIVNPFILKNKSKMIKYLDDLSTIPDCPPAVTHLPGQSVVSEEPSRELAFCHAICEQHREDIHQLAQSRPTIRKLMAITEMLCKRKTRFQQLISNSK